MRANLPGQMDLPQTEERMGELAKRIAEAPMRPNKPQLPCDTGLFGDDAAQLDLLNLN